MREFAFHGTVPQHLSWGKGGSAVFEACLAKST